MPKHRNPRPKVSKQPPTHNLNPGDLIIRARTAELLWAVAHAARATTWAPETSDCGATVYAVLDDALDNLDAHVRSGGA
ncbi:MAG TPA: hypothetical protein VMS11_11320 [Solirubrobacterales bacterium]|nr:hypothetical protein [Solirubrobacterales bacterium]